ncbi:unnamed protein product [Cylicostephanus goldi]|uniref:Protein kinase domain-containing protein n=1 Tax=Cylicostephanus goldi TaxID=71465 RepID=A0A3P6QNM0_CYLGO|nr:unnamed protein product [Cylicostephanus goldi]
METIGEGTFSVVKRAIWYHPGGSKIDVAVKILRDVSPSLVEDLEVEASHLLKLQHSNLIRLFGIVRPAMMVSFHFSRHSSAFQVFELCEGGELLTRLRDSSKPAPLVTLLLEYCLQIAKALTFLESKHVVHRDVAARNVLLSKDEKVCQYITLITRTTIRSSRKFAKTRIWAFQRMKIAKMSFLVKCSRSAFSGKYT